MRKISFLNHNIRVFAKVGLRLKYLNEIKVTANIRKYTRNKSPTIARKKRVYGPRLNIYKNRRVRSGL